MPLPTKTRNLLLINYTLGAPIVYSFEIGVTLKTKTRFWNIVLKYAHDDGYKYTHDIIMIIIILRPLYMRRCNTVYFIFLLVP